MDSELYGWLLEMWARAYVENKYADLDIINRLLGPSKPVVPDWS